MPAKKKRNYLQEAFDVLIPYITSIQFDPDNNFQPIFNLILPIKWEISRNDDFNLVLINRIDTHKLYEVTIFNDELTVDQLYTFLKKEIELNQKQDARRAELEAVKAKKEAEKTKNNPVSENITENTNQPQTSTPKVTKPLPKPVKTQPPPPVPNVNVLQQGVNTSAPDYDEIKILPEVEVKSDPRPDKIV